jgi:hypothetical protein
MTEIKTVPIPTKAGDLIIWSRLLFHGNGRNMSRKVAEDGTVLDPGRPRLAQYVFFQPEPEDLSEWERLRRPRIEAWEKRLPPIGQEWAKGDPRGKEVRDGKTAKLTELGKRVLGLERWPESSGRFEARI